MSQYRKLTNERLDVDQIIVAFNPRSKAINRPNGTFVKVLSKADKSVKVQVLGTKEELRLNLGIKGAWAYDPNSADTQVIVNCVDFNAWPRFTPRMQAEGWQGKTFKFDSAELHLDRDERSQGFGLTLLRHRGDTVDPDTGAPYINNFLMSSIFPAEPPEWRVPRAERMGVGAIELPLPPKPVSAEEQAIIDAITPIFSTLNQASNQRENVSFAKFSADMKKERAYLNQACHRALQEEENFPVQYIASYCVHKGSGHWKKGWPVNEEAVLLYITYLTNYSPYAEAFVTKDPVYIKKHGYIVNADAPKRLLVGGLYATRQLWERPQRADGFYELYKAGVSLDMAFVFGCQTSEYKNGKMKMNEAGSSHSHLNHNRMSDECILNFIEHTPTFAGEPYTEDCYASGGKNVDDMWSSKSGTRAEISKKLGEIKGVGQWGSALSVDDMVEQAADLIDDWSHKMGV